MGIKIWERYFLKEFLYGFFLFLVLFYGFYVLIDYANHTTSLHHHHVHFNWKEFAFYYACEFLKRLDILVPFAILIATIRSLCNLNVHNELVALMASGLNLKKALRPFLLMGLLGTCLIYLNMETLLPRAMRKLQYFEDIQKSEKNRNNLLPSANHLTLEDGSVLLFNHYDSAQRRFFDTYWIRSFDNIYKIKFLDPHTIQPIGYFVDHLLRNVEGNLSLTEIFQTYTFPNMKFNNERLIDIIIPTDNMPLSTLWKKLPNASLPSNEKEARIHTAFICKMLLPWLCPLAVIGPAPFCLFFTRQLPVFFIYAGSIFALLTFYLVIDAAKVLAERQVLSPDLALGAPFLLLSSFLTYRFLKI